MSPHGGLDRNLYKLWEASSPYNVPRTGDWIETLKYNDFWQILNVPRTRDWIEALKTESAIFTGIMSPARGTG